MKYVVILLVFTAVALVGWPYLYLFRLDRAVSNHDMAALETLVDVPAIRAELKERLEGGDPESGTGGARSFLGWIREGIRQIGGRAVDISVDLEWVQATLSDRDGDPETRDPTVLSATTYAFFESWDTFLVRLGDLGRNPMHLRMTLDGGRWRVTGIYD